MKKKFKNVCLHLTLILSVIFLLLLCSFGIISAKKDAVYYKVEPRVYLRYGDEKYFHYRDGCSSTKHNEPVGLYSIQEAGYTACPQCGGTPWGTIQLQEYIIEDDKSPTIITAVVICLIGLSNIVLLYVVFSLCSRLNDEKQKDSVNIVSNVNKKENEENTPVN
jgi:hypothetical protein